MKNTILVVDDDSIVLFIHQVVIQESAFTAESKYFLSAASALEYIENEPDQDTRFLIFLDLNMPILNGWQLLDELQQHPKRENIFVTIVSSSIDNMDIEKAYSYAMVVDYIAKPLKEEYFEKLKGDERLSVFFQ